MQDRVSGMYRGVANLARSSGNSYEWYGPTKVDNRQIGCLTHIEEGSFAVVLNYKDIGMRKTNLGVPQSSPLLGGILRMDGCYDVGNGITNLVRSVGRYRITVIVPLYLSRD